MVASVEEHLSWPHLLEGQQQQQHLQRLLTAVNEVAVEDVRVFSRRQPILLRTQGVDVSKMSCNNLSALNKPRCGNGQNKNKKK